jgi:hypothetical protein
MHTQYSNFSNSLYGVKASLTLRQEHRLKTLKRIYGPKKEGVKETVKECLMERFIICVLSPNIIKGSQIKGG